MYLSVFSSKELSFFEKKNYVCVIYDSRVECVLLVLWFVVVLVLLLLLSRFSYFNCIVCLSLPSNVCWIYGHVFFQEIARTKCKWRIC